MTAAPNCTAGGQPDGGASLGCLHHVTVAVSDLERSAAFYRDALGLRATLEMSFDDEGHEVYLGLPRGASGRAVALRTGRSPAAGVTLVQFDPPPRQPVAALTAQPGACMLAFELDSVAAVDGAHARVTALGHEAVSDPKWADIGAYGRIRGVTIRDPDGFLIEIYAPEGGAR